MYWSQLASSISPYVPGEQPKEALIKLNTNENPYPPSPKTLQAIARAVNDELRLYPDPECTALRDAIARAHGLHSDQVFVGNGSDEVLALCFLAFCDPDTPVRFADITYSFYPVYAALYRMQTDCFPLNADFTVPVDALLRDSGPLIIANPNAPTSLALSLDEIERILQFNRSHVVIVDEAYAAFSGQSVVPLIERYENLLIVKTFSKSHSLAGLRVGYALGNPRLVEALVRVKNSFNSYPLDRIALAGAQAAIEDATYYQATTDAIVLTRDVTAARLKHMGFRLLESRTNFLFVTHLRYDALQLMQDLRENGILVRHFCAPRICNYLRITVGTDEEMRRLIDTLELLLKKAALL